MMQVIDILARNPETGYTAFCLQVSTNEELPALGDPIGSDKVGAGTIVQVIQDDTFLTLDENGEYYPETK